MPEDFLDRLIKNLSFAMTSTILLLAILSHFVILGIWLYNQFIRPRKE